MVNLQLGDLNHDEENGGESSVWRGKRLEKPVGSKRMDSRTEGLVKDLGVLVGGDGREGGLREGEGLEDAPADAVEVVSLNNVEARVVAVHGVEDDL